MSCESREEASTEISCSQVQLIAGKHFFSTPLHLFSTRFVIQRRALFAWIGAETAECIFLNDFRWSPQLLPWHDLLLLLEGHVVHLPAPKTHFAKDIIFKNDTPIFCTSKNPYVFIKNGVIDERETEMMRVRWKLIQFNHQIPPNLQKDITSCLMSSLFCQFDTRLRLGLFHLNFFIERLTFQVINVRGIIQRLTGIFNG